MQEKWEKIVFDSFTLLLLDQTTRQTISGSCTYRKYSESKITMPSSTQMNNILLWIYLETQYFLLLFKLAGWGFFVFLWGFFCCSAFSYRERLGVSWSYSTWCFNGMSGRIASNRGNLLGSLITSFRSPTSTGRFIDLQKHSDKTSTGNQHIKKKLRFISCCARGFHVCRTFQATKKDIYADTGLTKAKQPLRKQTFCKERILASKHLMSCIHSLDPLRSCTSRL